MEQSFHPAVSPVNPSGQGQHQQGVDPQILTLLRAGGQPRQAAVGQLFHRYARDFRNYFRRHSASEASADDLVQETFVKVIRGLDGWTGAGSLEAWLWTVARNTLLSSVRVPAAEQASVALDALEPGAAEALLDRVGHASDPADADCVKRGLERFTIQFSEYAHVLERVVLDGWGYEELAQFRGSALGAAREYLSQCRKRLWPYISHCYDGAGT